MSIAISTLIQPPLLIIAILRIFCSGIFLLAFAVWFNLDGRLAWPFDIAVPAACIAASMYGFYFSSTLVKSFRISIYPNGRLTLCPATSTKLTPLNTIDAESNPISAEIIAGTTIWPHLIILRLRLTNGKTVFIFITDSSVASETFRPLTVACRWIVHHNDPAQGGKS